PPHVWAIALFRKADYAAAGIPMLPNVIGDQPTRRRMLLYTLALVPFTLAPTPLGLLGPFCRACAARAERRGRAPHVRRVARLPVRVVPRDARGPGAGPLTTNRPWVGFD